MNKVFYLLFTVLSIFFYNNNLKGQCDTSIFIICDTIIENDTIYLLNTYAEYPGGELELLKYIAEEFKLPYKYEEALDYNFYCGTAWVKFIVTKKGYTKNASMVRPKAPKYENECIRLVNTMKFKPVTINGCPVNSWRFVRFVYHYD